MSRPDYNHNYETDLNPRAQRSDHEIRKGRRGIRFYRINEWRNRVRSALNLVKARLSSGGRL